MTFSPQQLNLMSDYKLTSELDGGDEPLIIDEEDGNGYDYQS